MPSSESSARESAHMRWVPNPDRVKVRSPYPSEPIYGAIGKEVRRKRRAIEMTQAELATATGYARSTIVNMESGRQRIQLHTMLEIADKLGISATELLRLSIVATQ